MDCIKDVLQDYFKELKSRPHHSNLSWENCYKFFYENRSNIVNNDDMLEKASLHLAFYLASWGMYRGSAFIRRYDHNVFKNLIKQLLTECKKLWDKNVTWENLEHANNIISGYFPELKINDKSRNNEKYKNEPTQTLITKILMGIFGCIPAYDRYLIKALKANNICQTYNEESYKALNDWWKQQKYSEQHYLNGSKIAYPLMKLIDIYFWSVGEKLEEEEKEKKNKE